MLLGSHNSLVILMLYPRNDYCGHQLMILDSKIPSSEANLIVVILLLYFLWTLYFSLCISLSILCVSGYFISLYISLYPFFMDFLQIFHFSLSYLCGLHVPAYLYVNLCGFVRYFVCVVSWLVLFLCLLGILHHAMWRLNSNTIYIYLTNVRNIYILLQKRLLS